MEPSTPTLEQLETDLAAVECVMARLEAGVDSVCVRCRDLVDDPELRVLPVCVAPSDSTPPSQLSLPTESTEPDVSIDVAEEPGSAPGSLSEIEPPPTTE